MPAHKIPLRKSECDADGCSKRPAWLVRSTRNEPMGEFCAGCADAKLEELNGPPEPKARPPKIRKRSGRAKSAGAAA